MTAPVNNHAAPAARVQIVVGLGDRSYPITIGEHLLEHTGSWAKELCSPGKCAVVTNPVVGAFYADIVVQSLRTVGFEPVQIEVPDGEEHKNLASLALIYDRLVDAALERSSVLFALGGGVIGDLAGFAAATYLRGIPYVQLPTTLLAQVDSSVGGKTGIDHPRGKNLIGAFYQPRGVLIDVCTLTTLSRRQLLAGFAEVVKYGAIFDAEFFALLERELERILAVDLPLLVRVVRRCCELKAGVVERDERESGERAVLNFGHTIGHALESATSYQRYLHGEAVAIGMVAEARVSAALGLCSFEVVHRLHSLLERAGLPVALPGDVDRRQLAAAIELDKKVQGGKVKFVGLEDLGKTRFVFLTNEEIIELADRAVLAKPGGKGPCGG
ncbi:MAG: 3-dehydroquinate synthase [Candidatus Binatia bacterium]|nr:3-dehydroquinate synthase [Candidatus Binatia bacterium]